MCVRWIKVSLAQRDVLMARFPQRISLFRLAISMAEIKCKQSAPWFSQNEEENCGTG